MSKVIERRMTLKDQVTPTMNKINKNTLTYKKHVKDLHKDGQRTWSGLKRGMLGVVATGAALLGSVMAINKMEEAYKAQSLVETKLQAVFKATARATEEQVQGLKAYASEMQKVGVVGDEIALSGMQQLATFNVSAKSVKVLTDGMLDLVAQQKGLEATQQDMVNIGNMVGKVMGGQIGALSRVGISFTAAQEKVLKFGTEEEKAATLAAVLAQNVGGVNAALAATDEGQIKQVKNSIGDLQEIIGGVVIKVKGEFARAFNESLPAIEAKINSVTNAINNWVDSGGINRFIDTLKIVYQTTKDLTPVIALLGYGLAAYKLYALAATVQTWNLNAAMAANPIGFVVAAIVGLITVIVLVRKNQELLRLKFMQTWNSGATASEKGVNFMIGALNSFLSAGEFVTKSITYAFHSMWNSIVEGAESKVKALATPLNAVLTAMGKETINVDFSSKLSKMEKPVWEKKDYIKEIQIKKYSDDDIMDQIEKAKKEKQIKQAADATKATNALADALSENTDAVGKNTSALGKSTSDLSGEEIADKLLPRLERVIYG